MKKRVNYQKNQNQVSDIHPEYGSETRVLMLVTSLEMASGVTTFVMNYIEDLARAGFTVDVLNLKKAENSKFTGNTQKVQQLGGNVYSLPGFRKPAAVFSTCRKIFREHKYSIVHNNSLLLALPVMICAWTSQVPIRILHSHNAKLAQTRIKEIRNGLFIPLLRRFSNRFAACSDLAGDALFNKAFTLIPNAVSVESFQFSKDRRDSVRAELNISSETKTALCVGRLCEQKNVMFALSCFRELNRINPETVMLWAGDGEKREEAEKWIEENGMQNRIILLGDRSDTADLYSAADLFFLPSLFEGLPLTAIEAQSAGLPCLLSDTISKEVKCLDNLSFYPLEKSPAEWGFKMNKMLNLNIVRQDENIKMRSSRYSLSESRKMLPELYRSYLAGETCFS